MQRVKEKTEKEVTYTAHEQPATDDHVFLIGRPPMGEFLGFVSVNSAGPDTVDLRQRAAEWREANDHIRELEGAEAGAADNAPIESLPPRLAALEPLVQADPTFQRSFQVVPVEIGMVELDRLVVFQKHIDLTYVGMLQAALGSDADEEAIFRLCLPFEHANPPVRVMRTAQNAYTFISPSNDFRLLDVPVLRGDQLSGYASNGVAAYVVALVVGYGSNYLNALHSNGRLILNNGSHRAYALRDIGVTHVPCIVQHLSRPEELEVIAAGDVPKNPELYLEAPRPPMLKDYFDAKLRTVVPVPRKLRQVNLSFGAQQADIPAA
jgi:hypothetical protein